MPGQPPKRSSQRRRRNKPDIPIKTAPGAADIEVPEVDEDWHPVAKAWYESLAVSGQSHWYEPSDWATAVVIAEGLSRDLNPIAIGYNEDIGEVVWAVRPVNGTRMNAYLKGMADLLTTETARRRARIELERPKGGEENGGSVTWISDNRRSG